MIIQIESFNPIVLNYDKNIVSIKGIIKIKFPKIKLKYNPLDLNGSGDFRHLLLPELTNEVEIDCPITLDYTINEGVIFDVENFVNEIINKQNEYYKVYTAFLNDPEYNNLIKLYRSAYAKQALKMLI